MESRLRLTVDELLKLLGGNERVAKGATRFDQATVDGSPDRDGRHAKNLSRFLDFVTESRRAFLPRLIVFIVHDLIKP